MAALLEGQDAGTISKKYNVPASTIKSWKSRQGNNGGVAIVATEKKRVIGDLILEYLEKSLVALIAQVEVFAEKDYLRGQDASELAVLHGVGIDKVFRIAEALAPKDEADTTDEQA